MDLVRWEPFEGLNRIQSRINDLFDDTFDRSRAYPSSTTGVWFPPVDILESKDSYLIRAELPGMKKEDFNLEVHDGSLTLSGERKFEEPANGVEYHRVERVAGASSLAPSICRRPSRAMESRLRTETASWRYTCQKPRRRNRNRLRLM